MAGNGIALVLHRRLGGRGALRALVLIPWAFPLSIAATLTRLTLVAPIGALSHMLGQMGLSGDRLTTNSHVLLVAVIVADIWTSTAFLACCS